MSSRANVSVRAETRDGADCRAEQVKLQLDFEGPGDAVDAVPFEPIPGERRVLEIGAPRDFEREAVRRRVPRDETAGQHRQLPVT